MDQRAVKGWIMFDWAHSAFATTMMAAVLPIFYSAVAASTLPESHLATVYWGNTQTIAMIIVALISPILGAVADFSGSKVRLIRWFTIVGALASASFVLIGPGDYLLASFILIVALIGYSVATSVSNGLLSDLVPEEKRDMISAKGFAYGYIGGGILLVINLAMILKPGWFGLDGPTAGMKASFVTVALWWLLFAIPLFRHVKDRRRDERMSPRHYINIGFGRTWKTLKSLSRYPELLKFLIAYWFFNDGISTIITMATIYGKEIGLDQNHLISALVITQFIGIPCTLLFGKIAERIGSKQSLYVSLSIYVLIVTLGFFMSETWHFYALAVMVGFVQGGSQAISRSIYSRLAPADRSAEFFGFLNISDKFSAIMGPALFSAFTLWFGSGRFGILVLIAFFLIGIGLLTKVRLEKGKREALAG